MKNNAPRLAYYLQRLSETHFERRDVPSFTAACNAQRIPMKYREPLRRIIFPGPITHLVWPPVWP